jgi:hypothetical protein
MTNQYVKYKDLVIIWCQENNQKPFEVVVTLTFDLVTSILIGVIYK